MFIHYRTQGFVLKKDDQGEADQLLTVYTKDFGKLKILARSIRKISSKLRSGIELFYLSEIEFVQGKNHKTLTDAILIDSFEETRKSLTKLSVAFKVSDVLDSLIKGQESDEKIWQLLIETFQKLNNLSLTRAKRGWEMKERPSATVISYLSLLYYYFLWNLFSLLGYQIETYHCLICQRKLKQEDIFLDPKNKGLICSLCQAGTGPDTNIISPEIIKIIRILLKKDWSLIEGKDASSLELISSHYLAEVLK